MDPVPPDTTCRITVVVMGVSGSGKSTVAAGIAHNLGLDFIDGDSLHSQQSVSLMQGGIALTDEDRWPWLDRIGARLANAAQSPRGVVVACSALKRSYRDRIRAAAPAVRFVFLDGPAHLIESRMATRHGHFMPSRLLASQLQTLERPGIEEHDTVHVDISLKVEEVIAGAVHALLRGPSKT